MLRRLASLRYEFVKQMPKVQELIRFADISLERFSIRRNIAGVGEVAGAFGG
jgi:hypothetical protein